MKKVFSLAVVFMIIISTFSNTYAKSPVDSEKEEFNLIKYLENNEVLSTKELENAILENATENIFFDNTASTEKNSIISKSSHIENFKIKIDKKNELVYVTEITSTNEISPSKSLMALVSTASGTSYTKGGTAIQNVYNRIGVKIFTVKTFGEFQYDKSTYCKVIDASGYFTSSFLSLWNSNCTVDDRDLGTTAYVKTYGTATLDFTIAQIFGLDIAFQTSEYVLKLTCDKNGNITSTWSNRVN